jgi:hypothetical protein
MGARNEYCLVVHTQISPGELRRPVRRRGKSQSAGGREPLQPVCPPFKWMMRGSPEFEYVVPAVGKSVREASLWIVLDLARNRIRQVASCSFLEFMVERGRHGDC